MLLGRGGHIYLLVLDLLTWIRIAKIPMNKIILWKTSVQITALIPPCKMQHSCKKIDYIKINFQFYVVINGVFIFFSWIESVQFFLSLIYIFIVIGDLDIKMGRVMITSTCLTHPHIYDCSNSGSGFPMLYIVFVLW